MLKHSFNGNKKTAHKQNHHALVIANKRKIYKNYSYDD